MKTVIIFILLFVSAVAADNMSNAPAIEWERLYGSTFLDVQETYNGDYVVAGRRWYNYARTIFLYSPSGEKLWESSVYPYNRVSFAVIQLESGDFIATGCGTSDESSTQYSLSIYKISSDGQALWSKVYELEDNGKSYGSDIVELPDGGLAVCGRKDPVEGMDQAWILRTDSQGDTLWTREWGWIYNDKALKVFFIDNGLTVMTQGRLQATSGGPHLIRYDLDGNLLWETDIPVLAGRYARDICRASDTGFFLLVDNFITCIDLQGNMISYEQAANSRTVTGKEFIEEIHSWGISSTMDGGYVYCGMYYYQWLPAGPHTKYGWIIRRDSTGKDLWGDYITDQNCTDIFSVRQLSQGGYIAAGKVWSPEDGQQGFLRKYAPETGIESGDVSSTFGITELSPNPFSAALGITFNLPSEANVSIIVYDLAGRVACTVADGVFPAGSSTLEWVAPDELSSGCYLVQLDMADGHDIRNCVLLR